MNDTKNKNNNDKQHDNVMEELEETFFCMDW